MQDVSGGLPVKVESPFGGELPLHGMQIDLEQAREELRAAVAGGGTAGEHTHLVHMGRAAFRYACQSQLVSANFESAAAAAACPAPARRGRHSII